MANEKDRLLSSLESAKIIVGIIAVLVGGYWTYLKFIRTEAPLFENSARVDWSLSAPTSLGEDCIQSFNVRLVNTGKSVFTVEKVLTRGWQFHLQRDPDKAAKLLDLDEIEAKGKLIFEKPFLDPRPGNKAKWYPLLGKYRPGEEYSHEFLVLLRRDDMTWIFLKTEIFIEGESTPKVAGVWGLACAPQSAGP